MAARWAETTPRIHASAGWDWMSTIRGRIHGHLEAMRLTTTSGPVTIEDPLVTTSLPLPDTTHADVMIQATLRNLDTKLVNGTLARALAMSLSRCR